jgi:hypothetical protein
VLAWSSSLVAWFVTAPLRDRAPTERDDPAIAELADSRPQDREIPADPGRGDRRAAGKLTRGLRRLDRELRAEATTS